VRHTEGTDAVYFLNKSCNLMMNFWTPTFPGWSDNFDAKSMPWVTKYDYVKVETYNGETEGFEFLW